MNAHSPRKGRIANPDHLNILLKGVEEWNTWREQNPEIIPVLKRVKLQDFDLHLANLRFADLYLANLSGTNLRRSILSRADLRGAVLHKTDLIEAELVNTKLDRANLVYAGLVGTKFCGATLFQTNLTGSHLVGADFTSAELAGSNFFQASLGETVFVATDLSRVKGLDTVHHMRPSSIGLDTIFKSHGSIPEKFLRGAGVPETFIKLLPSLIESMQPIQWHTCFISYSTKNDEFAQRLHARMRQAGLRVWFAPEDMKGGDYFFEQIERAIQLHDRLLLVLSEDSIQSKWVEREIRKTRKVERAEKRRKLFPITLTDYATLKKWECLDSDTGEDLAEEVRKYHIPDFSNWKNHDAFERAFARLEKALRTSLGK